MPLALLAIIPAAIAAGTSAYSASQQAGTAHSALQLQQMEWEQNQANQAPWLQAGTTALGELMNLAPFQAPTATQAEATPGYQFQLQQGQQAVERSAAAKGGLLSGGTAKALDLYSQGVASTNYQNTYNNALNQYLTQYNKLAGISGAGQQAAYQLGQQGGQYAQTAGQTQQNIGAITASGYVGAANALNSGISQTALLANMMNNQSAITGAGYTPGYSSDVGLCWIAAELYGGWENKRVKAIQAWFLGPMRNTILYRLYARFGQRIAERIKHSRTTRFAAHLLFDRLLTLAERWQRRELV